MKRIIPLLLTFISLNVYSQIGTQADSVILITSGNGINEDEAVNSALRKSIEQAFGAFVSSKTEILNDSLISDKIISVSNGNIKNYKILSSVNINLNSVKVTVQSTVSINSLQSFCKNSGVISEYQGGMFARNLAIQKLNEINEFNAIFNISETTKELSNNIWDYKLYVKSPEAKFDKWNIPITVEVLPNKNIDVMQNYLLNSILGVGMNSEQVETYKKLNKPVYRFLIYSDTINKFNFPYSQYSELKVMNTYNIYLRNKKSLSLLVDMLYYIQYSHGNFMITDGVDSINIVESTMKTEFQNRNKFNRRFNVNRAALLGWSFFPYGRLGGQNGYEGKPYGFYSDYKNNNNADNYYLLKKRLINTYKELKISVERGGGDSVYYKNQMLVFADSSKCFCYSNDAGIREIRNGNFDSFEASGLIDPMDNIDLIMRINPYLYFKNKLRSKILIDKVVTEEHLSKIKNIEVLPITIIDKVY